MFYLDISYIVFTLEHKQFYTLFVNYLRSLDILFDFMVLFNHLDLTLYF